MAATLYAHDDAPLRQNAMERVVAVLAELLRRHGTRFAGHAEAHLQSQLNKDRPERDQSILWLLSAARTDGIDPRWHPLVARLVQAPPARRAPVLLNEILRAIPLPQREQIVLQAPLISWTRTTTESRGVVTYEWSSAWSGEAWWYLPACPTPAIVDAVVAALEAWSNLPALPSDAPRGFHPEPHAPFPIARAREALAACDPEVTKAALQKLFDDPRYDAALVRKLMDS